MRQFRTISLVLALIILASSCQRRPFSENTTAVNMKLKIMTEVVNGADVEQPEMMRVDLFDPATGDIAYSDYIPPTGGYIYPRPGRYDLLVYNIGTESTIVRNEKNINTVEAYTNEVSAFIRAQMEAFLKSRAEHRKQMAAEAEARQTGGSSTKNPATKDPIIEGTERIVNEPDYLWVGEHDDVVIPAVELDEEMVVTLEVETYPVVETWKVSVGTVEGLQWVSSITALMTGQVESAFIGTGKKSDDVVTIYFEMDKDEEKKRIVGTFNTFGKNPLYSSFLSLDINIIDNAGEQHHHHFDLTDQFFDNDEFFLEVEKPIVVDEPKVEGGGFVPSVGEWEDVTTDIEL